MTRTTTVALGVVLACALCYALGLTAGYSGCVAGASELFTNRTLRGM